MMKVLYVGYIGNLKRKNIGRCIAFINNAHMTENIHLAIATDAR